MIEDAIRTLFWAIAKLFLSASDWMYDMLNAVVNLNLAGSNEITYTWLFFLSFLSFATFIRVGYVLLRKTANEDEEIDIGSILKKITSIFLVICISLTAFFFALQAPSEITKIYNNVVTYDEKMSPSTAVISSTAKTPITSKLSDMSSSDEVIGIDTIDDKLNDEESGEYIYFYSYSELLLCIIGAFVVMCVQLNIVIDCAMRLFLNIFRFCIGFIPISSMVEEESTCGDWVRDIISDALTTASTLIFTNLVFGLMTLSQISSLNGIIRVVIFAVGLMTVYKVGEIIAKYMGASNLSSGGRAGTMLMGMGAMAATKATMKIISNSAKTFMDYLNNSRPMDGGPMVTPPFPDGGNGGGGTPSGSIPPDSSTMFETENSNGYFADSGLNQQTMQNTYRDQEQNNGSIIDQNPTTPSYMDSNKVGVTESYNSGISPQNNTVNSNDYDNSGKNKYNSSDSTSFINRGGVSFVDTPSQNHLYKDSARVYKPSVREKYVPDLAVSGVNV